VTQEADCENAYENPKCPYVTQINQHSNDVNQIKTALVGEDLQGGLVAKVQRLETFMKIAAFVSAAATVAFIGVAIKLIFGM
jgi:hypothetical protein